VYAREDILAVARTLLPALASLGGDASGGIAHELELLLSRAEAGEKVEDEILALLARNEATWARTRELLEPPLATVGGEELSFGVTIEPEAAPPLEPPPQDHGSVIRRTPHLDAPDEISTSVGTEFRVSIWVDTAPLSETEQGDEVVIEAPADVETVVVGVLATCSAQFEIVDEPYERLKIERDSEKSDTVSFTLRVGGDEDSGDAGDEAGISVLFVYNGRPVGSVRRSWHWDSPNGVARAVPTPAEIVPSLPVHVDARQPDLSVFITAPTRDGSHFMCSVATTLLPGRAEPGSAREWALPAAERVSAFVANRLEAMLVAPSAGARKHELLAAGHAFWEVAPEPFKDVLEELLAAGKAPEHIYVASEEPTMPWELMIPSFLDEEGLPVDRKPLGVEFAIGRWIRGDSTSPPQRVQVHDSFVIAPTYSVKPLGAEAELEFLSENLNGTKVNPVTIDGLDVFFGQRDASLLHFVCHGAVVDDDEAIYLEENEELRSGVVRALDGFKALCRKRRPLVFLNSCEVGGLVPSLGGVAGFPKTFAELGARAIIAPLWPVRDVIASEVAVEIYRRALAESKTPVAAIVRDIRARAYAADEFEDSFAAYCYYGDPASPLERVDA